MCLIHVIIWCVKLCETVLFSVTSLPEVLLAQDNNMRWGHCSLCSVCVCVCIHEISWMTSDLRQSASPSAGTSSLFPVCIVSLAYFAVCFDRPDPLYSSFEVWHISFIKPTYLTGSSLEPIIVKIVLLYVPVTYWDYNLKAVCYTVYVYNIYSITVYVPVTITKIIISCYKLLYILYVNDIQRLQSHSSSSYVPVRSHTKIIISAQDYNLDHEGLLSPLALACISVLRG